MSCINTKKYIESFIKIKDKNSKVIPFKLNVPQNKLYQAIREQSIKGKPIRIIILKARQMGFSTLTEAIIFKNTATEKNVKSAVVAHQADSTSAIFSMTKLMYDNLPNQFKPNRLNNSAKLLNFAGKEGGGLNSSIRCFTAGSEGIGRGDTIKNLHISEYAFWGKNKSDVLTGLLQTVPNTADSLIIIESTANGFDDFRKRWCDAVDGKSDFVAIFCAWWELDEYRMHTTLTDSDLDDYEKDIKKRYNLDFEQLEWRRWCLKNNCNNDINMFKQEYPACADEAFISTGLSVFDKEKIIERKQKAPKEKKRGFFDYVCNYNKDGTVEISNIKFVDDENGIIKIFEEPQEGYPYVLGGDTAGDSLGDFFTCYGISNIDGEQVCSLKQQSNEDEYACQMYCLSRYYNNALIAIENNFSSYPNKFLQKAGYENIYVENRIDSYTNAVQKRYGFRTTVSNRNYILAELKRIVRENINAIKDDWLLDEMLVFVKNERGKEEAMQGEHDDMIMATAICYQAREQQECSVKQDEKIRDMFHKNFNDGTGDKGDEIYGIW